MCYGGGDQAENECEEVTDGRSHSEDEGLEQVDRALKRSFIQYCDIFSYRMTEHYKGGREKDMIRSGKLITKNKAKKNNMTQEAGQKVNTMP